MKRWITTAIALLLTASFTWADPPTTAPTTQPAILSVGGKVTTPLTLDAGALAKLPRQEVRTKDHAGADAVYAGVPLRAILQQAGAPIGNNQLRGPALALYVLAEGRDGYRVVFALAEIDADFAERNILVADTRDGQPLNDKEGPFRIIVPDEKKQARSIRELTSITIEAAPGGKDKPADEHAR